MLRFERAVVAALSAQADEAVAEAVAAFVDGTLRDMPQVIRAGVAVESIVIGAAVRLVPGRGGPPVERVLALMEATSIMPLRQYVRVFRSLVLYAENEVHPGMGAALAAHLPVEPVTAGAGRA